MRDRGLRVYYSRQMAANTSSYSPSAGKPTLVLEDWQSRGFKLDVVAPAPADSGMISAAHDPAYVRGVLSCDRPNGFGNTDESVAKSLPYTVGAMVCAARYAFESGNPAAALCSGFHHAGYFSGGGFCTFNGLMVAALEVHAAGAARVGILDLDEHYGNGTDDIIRQLNIDWIEHYTAGRDYGHDPADAEPLLAELPRLIERRFNGVQIILAQLGADPYIHDPLGGWMTIDQLARRDRIVFDTAKRLRVPVAWNLAGGYSRDADGQITPVLEIHANSARAYVDLFGC